MLACDFARQHRDDRAHVVVRPLGAHLPDRLRAMIEPIGVKVVQEANGKLVARAFETAGRTGRRAWHELAGLGIAHPMKPACPRRAIAAGIARGSAAEGERDDSIAALRTTQRAGAHQYPPGIHDPNPPIMPPPIELPISLGSGARV